MLHSIVWIFRSFWKFSATRFYESKVGQIIFCLTYKIYFLREWKLKKLENQTSSYKNLALYSMLSIMATIYLKVFAEIVSTCIFSPNCLEVRFYHEIIGFVTRESLYRTYPTLLRPSISFLDLGLPSEVTYLRVCLFWTWPSKPFFDLKKISHLSQRNSDALWT